MEDRLVTHAGGHVEFFCTLGQQPVPPQLFRRQTLTVIGRMHRLDPGNQNPHNAAMSNTAQKPAGKICCCKIINS
jgi:hypothetical protein